MNERDRVLAFLDTRMAHFNSCGVCLRDGWVGACGWNDPDPLRPPETDADLTDTAKQAAGWYLSALVLVLLGVIACAGAALYVGSRS